MPRVSIIVPAYNAEPYLGKALQSILSQTLADWEVILVDDGSTDGTRAVAESAAPLFGGRLHYFHQANRGVAAARNAAIGHASGEFLAMLDADDVWLPRRLELGVAIMDRDPKVGLVHGNVARVDADGKFLEYPPHPARKFQEGYISREILTRRAHLLCLTVLARKKCVDEVGGFDESMKHTEDRDLWFRIAKNHKVAYLDEVIAEYRITGGSLTRDSDRLLQSQLNFIEKHRKTGACTKWLARQASGTVYRERGDARFNAGLLGPAIRDYARSVILYPLNLANNYMFVRGLAEVVIVRFRARKSSA